MAGVVGNLGEAGNQASGLSMPCSVISSRSLNFSESNVSAPPPPRPLLILTGHHKVKTQSSSYTPSWQNVVSGPVSPLGYNNATLSKFSAYTLGTAHPLLSLPPFLSILKLLGHPIPHSLIPFTSFLSTGTLEEPTSSTFKIHPESHPPP